MTATDKALALDDTVVAIPDQVFSDLDGEAVILSLRDSTYYGLNEVGARVWALIQAPASVRAVCAAILEEYEVEPAQCERDVLALLGDLAANSLIEVRPAANG